MQPTTELLLLTVGAVICLVLLVTWAKVNAFLALMISALLMGVATGLPALTTLKVFQEGLGATMGGVAAVISLGAILGKLLAESGGARVLAERFNAFFGPNRVGWCIIALGIAVGFVTWFAVGLLMLLPILLSLARESKRPFLHLALPLLAILSVMHGLMPPHPGPVVAIDMLKADLGKVIGYGFLIGLPTAAVAGPIFARLLTGRITVPVPELATAPPSDAPTPSFGVTFSIILMPIALMLLATLAELPVLADHPAREVMRFIGHPVVAMTLACLAAGVVCIRGRPGGRAEVLRFTEQSVASIGMTLLIVGAGGGFARVLRETGAANALGEIATALHFPPLLYGWMIAAFIRVATGSATVAITTASGILAPLVLADPTINRELLVISVGCRSLFLSHLNDGAFWIVKDVLGMTVSQTLRTWTVVETLIGLFGLGFTLLVASLIA